MAEPNIAIVGVTMTPNPVETGKPLIISADVRPIKYMLDIGDGYVLDIGDGYALQIEE